MRDSFVADRKARRRWAKILHHARRAARRTKGIRMISSRSWAWCAAAGASLVLCLAATPALAEDGGVYVGATGGLTAGTYGEHSLDDAVVASASSAGYGLKLGTTSLRAASPVGAVVVGYMPSASFGLEASYLYLNTQRYRTEGKETGETVFGTPFSNPLALALNLTSRGPALALVGVLPLTNSWQLDGRVGAYEGSMRSHYWSAVGTYKNSGSESETSTSLMANAGTSYSFAGHWMLRLEYVYLNHLSEKLLGQSYNTGLAMAGVTYWF
jgi:opacity protein-like surface antigen